MNESRITGLAVTQKYIKRTVDSSTTLPRKTS